jgi:putative ABC transport system substrate-binding protein
MPDDRNEASGVRCDFRRRGVAALGSRTAAMPVIGCLHVASADPFAHLIADFAGALNEGGYTEGRNVVIEFRWAEGRYERLPALAADLVQHKAAICTENQILQ